LNQSHWAFWRCDEEIDEVIWVAANKVSFVSCLCDAEVDGKWTSLAVASVSEGGSYPKVARLVLRNFGKRDYQSADQRDDFGKEPHRPSVINTCSQIQTQASRWL
jgi:hypothetical protein